VLVAGEKQLTRYVDGPGPGLPDYLAKTDRPTTVIYPGAKNLAANLVAPDGSIAIRIVHDSFCQELIRRFGKPLVSTSANISGSPAPGNFAEIADEIKAGVDYIVGYKQGFAGHAIPSRIIRWENGRAVILRP
jgi:L-threonylcarbamoyladenylate synthase